MSRKHTRAALLWAAATDATFERGMLGEREVLAGKCIHCGRRQIIALDGEPLTGATVEHLVPRNHGGEDAVRNLAIACARCNQGKGARLDWRDWDDPTLQRVTETLLRRRAARWRDPPEGLSLPPPPEPSAEEEAPPRKGRRRRRPC